MSYIEEIRARLNKVTNLYTIEEVHEDYFDCPFCEGEGVVPGNQFVYENAAAGITVFGIGNDLKHMEDFVKNAPLDIKFLLGEVDRLRKS